MFAKSLAGHFTSLVDVRLVEDPWGLGIRIPVLRLDHDDWTAWRKEHVPASKALQLMETVTLKGSLARALNRSLAAATEAAEARPGFRQKRKATAAERASREETPITARELIDDAMAEIAPRELIQELRGDLNVLKPGIAQVLMTDRPLRPGGPPWSWHGVTDDETGEAVPFTLENKLRLLGWEGVLVQDSAGDHFLTLAERADYVLQNGSTVEEFAGHHRDAEGNLILVPADQPHGPAPLGDAIANWLLEAAEAGSIAATQQLQEAEEDLGDTQPGGSAISGA